MKKIILTLLLLTFGSTFAENINLSNLAGFDGEPHIAVNPANPKNIIAGWMRMRLDGKIWIAVKSSFDEGKTWSNITFMPHDTSKNGSADVSIAFHRGGTAYLSYINYRISPDTAGADYVVSSSDGGLNWSVPNKVFDASNTPDLPIDRPWIAVDNSGGPHDGTVYLTAMSAYWFAGQHHLYIRSSSDKGASWSKLTQIDNEEFSVGRMTRSSGLISIGADGTAQVAYLSYDTKASPFVRMYLATTGDLGVSFQHSVVGNLIYNNTNKAGDFTKSHCIACDPVHNGNLAIAWIDDRNGDPDVFLRKSTDSGKNWTLPLRVNDDSIINGVGQDEVWMNFSPNGHLALAWRDRRTSGKGDTVNFNIFSTMSTDGGMSFAPNKILSTISSPFINVPKGNSFIGVATSDNTLHVNWADLSSGDLDIYYANRQINSSVEELHYLYDGIVIAPNPAKDFIEINWISQDFKLPVDFQVRIYNIIGELILNPSNDLRKLTQFQAGSNKIKIDVTALKNGIYFVKITNRVGYSIKKFEIVK